MPSVRPLSDYPYRATFETLASFVQPTESDRLVAKASLQPLSSLLPAGIDVEAGEDVLYIAAAGAVAGLVNRNGDGITTDTALSIYRTALHKYLNFEHDRDMMVGAIINCGLTRMDSHEPLTDAEAAALGGPFNLSIAGVLWKVIVPQLSRYLVKVGPAENSDALSLSWEIAFSEFKLAYGSPDLSRATIISREDPQFETLEKCLRAKGGTGKGPDGQPIYRVICGDAIILGYSLVESPAAHVKGILPVVAAPVPEPAAPAVAETCPTCGPECKCGGATVASSATTDTPVESAPATTDETSAEVAQAASAEPPLSEKIITPTETRVTAHIAPMKIENLDQLKSQWPELRKLESCASIEGFVAAMQQANEAHLAKINETQDLAKSLESAKAAAEQKSAQLEASLAQVTKQVEDLRIAALAAEQNVKFQERMADLDETFDLDDEDRSLLASEVKSLADDAAFAAFKKKQEKLMCGKKKGAKASTATASTTETVTTATVKEAFASVTEVPGQTSVPPGKIDTAVADEMEAAFGSSIKIDGKTVKERRAEKAAAKE